MVRLGLQAMMKTKNSGIHLRNSPISSPTDILHYPTQDLFFMTPKRIKLYEMDNEEFKSLQDYYAIQKQLPEVAIIRRGTLWERIENKGMIFGSRYIFLWESNALTILWHFEAGSELLIDLIRGRTFLFRSEEQDCEMILIDTLMFCTIFNMNILGDNQCLLMYSIIIFEAVVLSNCWNSSVQQSALLWMQLLFVRCWRE